MKIPCKSIFLMLLAGLTAAYADPGQGRGARQQGYDAERAMQRNDRICPGPNGCAQNGSNANPRAPSKNNGRMTPEERSALRRQINEAGQDIYSGRYRR